MASKTEVITMHLANPEMTARELAEALGCRQERINHLRNMCGLDIPRERGRRGESITSLGRAALKAGLTVEAILAMGSGK